MSLAAHKFLSLAKGKTILLKKSAFVGVGHEFGRSYANPAHSRVPNINYEQYIHKPDPMPHFYDKTLYFPSSETRTFKPIVPEEKEIKTKSKNATIEDIVIDRLCSSTSDLSERPGTICIFGMPKPELARRVIDRGARDVIILDGLNTTVANNKEFAKQTGCRAYQLDFPAAQSATSRTNRYKTDVFKKLFGHQSMANPLRLQDSHQESESPSITCIGLVPPSKEPSRQRRMLQTIYYELIAYHIGLQDQGQSIHRWGPVEFWLFLTARDWSKKTILSVQSLLRSVRFPARGDRLLEMSLVTGQPFISKTAKFWSWMLNFLLQIEPLSASVPSITPEGVKWFPQSYEKHIAKAEIDNRVLYPFCFRPRSRIDICESLQTDRTGASELLKFAILMEILFSRKYSDKLLDIVSTLAEVDKTTGGDLLEKAGFSNLENMTLKDLGFQDCQRLYWGIFNKILVNPLVEKQLDDFEMSHLNRKLLEMVDSKFSLLSDQDYAD